MCVYTQARRLWIGGGAKVGFWEAYPPTTRSAKKTRVILSPFCPSLPKPSTTSIPIGDKKGEGSSRALTLCRWAKQHWMPKRKRFAFFWGCWSDCMDHGGILLQPFYFLHRETCKPNNFFNWLSFRFHLTCDFNITFCFTLCFTLCFALIKRSIQHVFQIPIIL